MPTADPARSFVPAPPTSVAHAPSGPLAGLALAVEDVFDVAGYPAGGGFPIGSGAHAATRTAPAVQALLDAGASLTGKTHTDAFGRTLDGAARGHGNPESSSSAALAVARTLSDVALCADVKGSVMASAGHLGLVGLRCGHERVTLQDCVVPAPSLIAAGLVARDSAALIRVAELLLGVDAAPLPSQPRLLLAADSLALLPVETRGRFAPVLHEIEAAHGPAGLVEAAVEGTALLTRVLDTLHSREAWDTHGARLDSLDPTLGTWIGGASWSAARAISRTEHAGAARRRTAFTERLTKLIGPGGVLLLPTLPAPGTGDHGELSLAILSGLPQVSIPVGGEPALGLSFIGPRGSDLGLARLAARIHGELR